MMSPSPIANPEANSNRSRESKRKKRRKIGIEDSTDPRPENTSDPLRWRSESQQRIYASKLVDALCQARPTSSSTVPGGRAVRETADRVLAVAAKGRSRWSRAILTGRLSLRLSQINKRHRHKKTKITGDNRLKKTPAVKKRLPPLQRKVRVLGQLIPGCRKVSFPNLLEEATDYIAALQMQVRAMTVLSDLLTSAGGGANGGSSQS